MSAKPTIGFVGVGSMGWPMAALLHKAGYPLQIIDASADRAKAFAKEIGGTVAASNRALAAASDIIITILPTSAIVQAVLEGPEGVLAGLRKDAVVVEMSSGVPTITRTLAEQVAVAGAHMVDAPVSGGVPRAKTGELAIMFGGSEAILERIRPVLSCMGTSITRTGDVGSAHAMKALNNLVSAGGFLIGVSAEVLGRMVELPAEWRLFLVTGFLGGFTTFSTFSAETVGLLERGMHGAALVLVLAHVVGSVVATVAGMACVRALAG